MFRCCAVVAGVVACSGSPSKKEPRDASIDDASDDASIDVPPPDAFVGVTDPPDPASTPCTGTLGFPGRPAAKLGGRNFQLLDFDQDGKLDVAAWEVGTLTIARGLGDGRFQTTNPVTIANATTLGARLADLNGDSRADLIFGGTQGTTDVVRVALNDGTGAFPTSQAIANGDHFVGQVEVIDINADGKRDIVTLQANDAIGVLLNTGTAFAAPQQYAAGSAQSSQIAIGDVTGDGAPDVVATNTADGTISVLANNGNGTFAARVAYPVPLTPTAIVLANVDGDADLDIVAGTSSASNAQVSVLVNAGAGVFGAATSYALGSAFAPQVLTVADVDNDGHVDIGAAETTGREVYVLRGAASGQFATPDRYTMERPDFVAFRDLDGNGRLDMLVVAQGFVSAMLHDGTTHPFETRVAHLVGSAPFGSYATRWVDLNDDARLDLVWIAEDMTASEEQIAVRLATSATAYAAPTMVGSTIGSTALVTDLSNDSRRDVVTFGTHQVQALRNTGTGTVSVVPPSGSLALHRIFNIALADIDGDGIRDLVVGDIGEAPSLASAIRWYPGNGSGTFGAGTLIWAGSSLNGFVVGDLDGNGRNDLVVGSSLQGFRQYVLLATGPGTFAPETLSTVSGLPGFQLFARDINKDGKLDVLGFDSDVVVVMLGNGDGTFAAPQRSQVPELRFVTADLAFADFDGDGHLDFAAPSETTIGIVRGGGDGTFHEPLHFATAFSIRGITLSAADADGDGRVDLLANGPLGYVSVHYGRCL